MVEDTDRVLEEIPGPLGAAREQGAEGRGGLRAVSEFVALVSASALAGGGVGMLVGIALGAINPFGLGIVGVVVGTGLAVFLARRPWWRRVFGG